MSRLTPRTLRGRFGWRAFLTSVVVLGAVTAGTALFWRAEILENTLHGLSDHIHGVESELQILHAEGQFPAEEGGPLILPAPERGVQVLSSNGELVAASAGVIAVEPAIPADGALSQPGATVTTIVDHPVFGHSLVAAETLVLGDETYAVEAITGLEDLDRACRIACLYLPVAALVVSVLVGLGVTVSVNYALRPVQRLTQRAGEVAVNPRPQRLGVTADTLELQELASRLDYLLDEIRESFDREQAFLDDASHELRTPIAIARAELELAQRSGPPAGTAAALRSGIEELDRVDATAADLLVLARARAVGEEGFRPTELAGVAERAARSAVRRRSRRNIGLTVQGAATVMGDAAALERALGNVIGNAIEHCSSSVEVALTPEAVITVSDDGPGVPEDLLPRFFERFSRGGKERPESTGLGTAIAAEIVAVHGGTIDIANGAGGGAVVTIRFPPAHK